MEKCKITLINTNLRRYTFESKKIKKWVETVCIGKTLNLFSGKTKLCIDEIRNDMDQMMNAEYHLDALEFIKQFNENVDTILLDPPYAYRKAIEMYQGNYTSKFKLIADEIAKRKIKRVVSFGYHSTFMGKVRGYELVELCVFAHGGAQHCTIGIVEQYI